MTANGFLCAVFECAGVSDGSVIAGIHDELETTEAFQCADVSISHQFGSLPEGSIGDESTAPRAFNNFSWGPQRAQAFGCA